MRQITPEEREARRQQAQIVERDGEFVSLDMTPNGQGLGPTPIGVVRHPDAGDETPGIAFMANCAYTHWRFNGRALTIVIRDGEFSDLMDQGPAGEGTYLSRGEKLAPIKRRTFSSKVMQRAIEVAFLILIVAIALRVIAWAVGPYL